MSQSTTQEFGKWRSRLWPVHAYELKKFIPMLLMFFLISFNYTVFRDCKDSIVVPSCGAGALPFIKVYGTVPAAVLFMLIYSKLSNILSKPMLFYVTIAPFVAFFALFAFVLYPYQHLFHPTESAAWLSAHLPENLAPVALVYQNWTFALFYVLSELWGSAILSLLFWGFANDITRVSEAKRFYALFGLGANIALVFSGECIKYFSRIASHLPEHEAWGTALKWMMGAACINGVLVMVIYSWMNRAVLKDPRFYSPAEIKGKKEKPKLGLFESFSYLAKSPYMLLIAAIVICYGMSINFVEVSWKGQIGKAFPNHTDYSFFMGNLSEITGIVTCLMILFVSGNIMRRYGWTVAAILTPVILGLTAFAFFGGLFAKEHLTGLALMFGTSPLILVVIFGLIQNVMSKATKYSLFDPTKEMSYIPLDQEQKVKGKAAIDVVGARLGKSGGSIVQQFLIATCGFAGMLPYAAVMVGVTIVAWIFAAKALGRRFGALQARREAESAAVKPAAMGAQEAKA